MAAVLSKTSVSPDYEGLLKCVRREGAPERVHNIELFLDPEVKDAVVDRFDLAVNGTEGKDEANWRREIAVQRALGYDYVRQGLDDLPMPLNWSAADDTAESSREGGRSFVDEGSGPITSWEEFEAYPWPDPRDSTTRALEWYSQNLPDDMCIIGSGGFGHFAEYLFWLVGYQTLCFKLFDDRDLVKAIADKLIQIYTVSIQRLLEFDRVKMIWGSDDMGFKTGTLISPEDLREFVLPGHRKMAAMAHAAGRPYLLHSCGNLEAIMDELINDVKIDAKHSFEDAVEPVEDACAKYGERLALLGGIDVDFLCRAGEKEIRDRVRKVLDACMPGGGYCLGTGNSVANYIPLDNYLIMLDEGRRWNHGKQLV